LKKTGVTLAVLLCSATVYGQYAGAPARDIREAIRYFQETQRSIEPAILDVRDQADVLNTLAQAALQLKESQPASSFDDADHVIDTYMRKRRENETALSRELDRTIAAARQILVVNKPILNVAAAREQLHHTIIHPMQRDAMHNAGELQALLQQLQFMQTRIQNQVIPQILNATASASTDAPK
jgi:hypothetical protein